MYFENFLLDAINVVLAWDISDEYFSQAVKDQAGLMARINPEEIGVFRSD